MSTEILERYEDKILETGLLTDLLPDNAIINGITLRMEPGEDDFQNLLIDIWTEAPIEIEEEQCDDIGLAVQDYLESKGAFTELGFDDDVSWFIKVTIKQ